MKFQIHIFSGGVSKVVGNADTVEHAAAMAFGLRLILGEGGSVHVWRNARRAAFCGDHLGCCSNSPHVLLADFQDDCRKTLDRIEAEARAFRKAAATRRKWLDRRGGLYGPVGALIYGLDRNFHGRDEIAKTAYAQNDFVALERRCAELGVEILTGNAGDGARASVRQNATKQPASAESDGELERRKALAAESHFGVQPSVSDHLAESAA